VLRDDHRSKPECLLELSQLFRSVGNYTENKQLRVHSLKPRREGGCGNLIAQTLMFLACATDLIRGSDSQLGAAEGAASQAIGLFTDLGEQFEVCQGYLILGIVCHSKGKIEEAITHFEAAIGIVSSFNYHAQLFWNGYSLVDLFFDEERFDEAHVHVERAKSHAVDDAFLLGRGMKLQAEFWHKRQTRRGEVQSFAGP
jgi:tetratricopeptide (TPR) repeat protein